MSDRHEKWTPVEPGHVIPAGQPYRQEHKPRGRNTVWLASERFTDRDLPVTEGDPIFVDSSWRPPLELPSEPTWGIVVYKTEYDHDDRAYNWTGEFLLDGEYLRNYRRTNLVKVDLILDFIPLTDEQVARIEAAR